jgi:A/G-specific adenine glycosylase
MGFRHFIIQWYERSKRDLPWRQTSDPYRIWLSEVILQQTRVDQGLEYYQRFIERFPDVDALAMAQEEEVMKLWQGLGYYTRARNLHQAARSIVHDHGAVFPVNYDDIRRLKGVGDYSAGAIASIAYNQPHPVIDGNVLRVVARYQGITEPVNTANGKKQVRAFLEQQLDPGQPGIFNQAVMELGALVCKPARPLCEQCPLSEECAAFTKGLTSELPIIKKTVRIAKRYFHYLVIYSRKNRDLSVWIRKREGNDIWKNLYDFPMIETEDVTSEEQLMKLGNWKNLSGKYHLTIEQSISFPKYLLSHRELITRFLIIRSDEYFSKDFKQIQLSDIHNYPVPRLIENFLKKVAERPGIFFKIPD